MNAHLVVQNLCKADTRVIKMNDRVIKVLLIEDNPVTARLIQEMLEEDQNTPLDLRCSNSLSEGLEQMAAEDIDVILLALSVSGSLGFDAFSKTRSQIPEVPIITITSLDDEPLAIKALRNGAQDYLLWEQIDSHLLTRAISHTIMSKEVDRMEGELISIVSHELRTPLTSILGSLSLVVSGDTGELPEQAKGMIDIAYRNSKRLLSLINDMLDVRKMESGRAEFRYQLLELRSVVTEAMEANSAYAEQLEVEFVLEDSSPEIMVNADNERLIQVLTNLLTNAAKFSPPGNQVIISILHHYDTEKMQDFARVAVADHGPGIPEDFRDRVFRKFTQAHASGARKGGGSGLGLSIARAIVEGMGGQIGFRTESGAGTTFHFDLPEYNMPSAHLVKETK